MRFKWLSYLTPGFDTRSLRVFFDIFNVTVTGLYWRRWRYNDTIDRNSNLLSLCSGYAWTQVLEQREKPFDVLVSSDKRRILIWRFTIQILVEPHVSGRQLLSEPKISQTNYIANISFVFPLSYFNWPSAWTVRGSSPDGGEIFRTRPDLPGSHPISYTMGTGSFSGVKRSGRGVNHHPYLAPRLKETLQL